MSFTYIQGKLGSGKTLQAVAIMRSYIERGCPVATNVDLRLNYLLGVRWKKVKAFRVPDRPCSEDLRAVGRGNYTKDKKKNGALVLDECGIWFNSRNWNSKGRQDVINFLILVRKLGWDVYLLVQNISVIDKQARDMLAQYSMYCVVIEEIRIPIISSFYRMLFGKAIQLPFAIHYADKRYGTSYNGMKADSFWYLGSDLYSAYNTNQEFQPENTDDPATSQGVFCYLPPSYYFKYPTINGKNIMRLTRIYLKKYNRVFLFFVAMLFGVFCQAFWNFTDPERFKTLSESMSDPLEVYNDYYISSYDRLPNFPENYTITNGTDSITSSQLIKKGVHVFSVDKCSLKLKKDDFDLKINCKGL